MGIATRDPARSVTHEQLPSDRRANRRSYRQPPRARHNDRDHLHLHTLSRTPRRAADVSNLRDHSGQTGSHPKGCNHQACRPQARDPDPPAANKPRHWCGGYPQIQRKWVRIPHGSNHALEGRGLDGTMFRAAKVAIQGNSNITEPLPASRRGAHRGRTGTQNRRKNPATLYPTPPSTQRAPPSGPNLSSSSTRNLQRRLHVSQQR